MPQMMPLNWIFLFLTFNLIFYIFLIYNYYNLNYFLAPSQSHQPNYSKSFYNFWPLN
uniref:ATP synthase complex subunit 8 n=1 Tax=Pseudopotamorites peniculus TaxID=2904919 RepID=A0A9E8LP85_9NEOP|nr:ATP synthase F0 subunit 8 [Pseudopotamorites peniculus]UZZ44302.1 ATP synthase F0 subunit 8 [Pseudopotamorites peniculus]